MLKYLRHTFLEPLQAFIHDSKSIGIILLLCTGISLLISNLPLTQETYTHFWQQTFNGSNSHHLQLGPISLPNSPLLLINDAFMAVFFLLAGMEIKRELLNGELASFKKSILPVAAAMGGMLFPALLYHLFNHGTPHAKGWAIPTATDIAFTLGVASLLGKRVPMGLKIFLTALAIIDDLGAILVIALFYGGHIQWYYLLGCAVITGILLLLNQQKTTFGIPHILLGILLWYGMYNSGIHATVAGVIFALLIPAPLLSRFEIKLHTPVYFLIIPLFALANTAIILPTHIGNALQSPMAWGILAGLCIGKPLGISLFAYILNRLKLAHLPAHTSLYQLIGGSMLAGIGFTMSIFIATLAFQDSTTQDLAKIAVLAASLLSMLIGYLWLTKARTNTQNTSNAQPTDNR